MCDVVWVALHFALECWVTLCPYQYIQFYHILSRYVSFFHILIYLLYLYHYHDEVFFFSVDNTVRIDVLSIVIGYFTSLIITMMSLGFYNYCSTFLCVC